MWMNLLWQLSYVIPLTHALYIERFCGDLDSVLMRAIQMSLRTVQNAAYCYSGHGICIYSLYGINICIYEKSAI